MKKVLVLLAEGFEEVEAVTPADYLTRAGAEVTLASLSDEKRVRGSRGITIAADAALGSLLSAAPGLDWDAIVCPGGQPGASNLAGDARVGGLLRAQYASGRIVAAICAAPAAVLHPLGILEGRTVCGFPGTEAGLAGARFTENRVERDGNLITSRGAGTAGDFAFTLIEALFDEAAARKIAAQILYA